MDRLSSDVGADICSYCRVEDQGYEQLVAAQGAGASHILHPPFMNLAVRESLPILILAGSKPAVRKRTGGELSEKVGPVSPGEVRFK